jgi:ATP-dependent RNA helicase DDX21
MVIQVEPPQDVETYIHRSGRTARAGKGGACITLFSSEQEYILHQMEKTCGITFNQKQPPTQETVSKNQNNGLINQLLALPDNLLMSKRNMAKEIAGAFDGNFEKALCAVLASKQDSQPPPRSYHRQSNDVGNTPNPK